MNLITLSEEAIAQLRHFQVETKKEGAGLRVSVVGGGCSGLSYKLDFQEAPQEGDKVFAQDGVKVFVDTKSALYLKGMTLNYSGGLNGTGFTFSNPNATKTCGCGTSFNV